MKKAKVNANNLGSIFPSFLSSLNQVGFSKWICSSELSHKLSLHDGKVNTTLTSQIPSTRKDPPNSLSDLFLQQNG